MLGFIIFTNLNLSIGFLLWLFILGGLYLEWVLGKLSWMV
jgi:hypothetical protein